MCFVVSWDVLNVGVSKADWELCVYINIVMSIDHDRDKYVVSNFLGCSKCGVSTADW